MPLFILELVASRANLSISAEFITPLRTMGDAVRTDGLLLLAGSVGISDMRRFRAGEGDIPRVLIFVADEVVVRAKEGEGSSDIRLREEDGEAAAMAPVLTLCEMPYCGGIGWRHFQVGSYCHR